MTEISVSTALRNPTPEATSEGKAVYIAALERRILHYAIRDIKMRAALELASGVPYDGVNFEEVTLESLAEMVAQDMARGLQISIQDARARVQDNKIISNPIRDSDS